MICHYNLSDVVLGLATIGEGKKLTPAFVGLAKIKQKAANYVAAFDWFAVMKVQSPCATVHMPLAAVLVPLPTVCSILRTSTWLS